MKGAIPLRTPVMAPSGSERHFRQSMAQLHTWAGLLPGWLLFVIFLFGTTAFFNAEISQWMRPEIYGSGLTNRALDKADNLLRTKLPASSRWAVALPNERNGSLLAVSWEGDGVNGASGAAKLDPATGEIASTRDTLGGEFLYRFHFDLHYMPWWLARYLVSIAALAMLVAILSGIVTHKKIFHDFFLLRFGKGQRSWLDAHNVTAILALPFHLMITYTGLVTLLFTLMPWAISANFGNEESFNGVKFPTSQVIEENGNAAPLIPLRFVVEMAQREWQGNRPSYIEIQNPGDRNSVIDIYNAGNRLGIDPFPIRINGVSGDRLEAAAPHMGYATVTQTVMIDLHAGRFSGPVLRWLYFLSGVGGTVMVASGLVLWTVKRRAKLPDPARPHFGFRLVERLNIGVLVGATAGIAAYFLANRLLPIGMAHRADWEINSLFIAWGGLLVWTLARPPKRAWVEALAACAALYALVPVVNALTTARGLIPSLIARDWVYVGFDLVMLAMAVGCAFTAWKVATHIPKAAPRRRTRELVEAAL